MSTTVSAVVTVQTAATITSTNLGNFTGRPQIKHTRKLDPGTVTKCYAKPRTTTGADSLDVTSLTDPFGVSFSFVTVKVLQIKNEDAAINVTVSGNLIGSDAVTVGPGRTLYIDTDRTVDSTHKVLTITPASGTVTYDVILLGT